MTPDDRDEYDTSDEQDEYEAHMAECDSCTPHRHCRTGAALRDAAILSATLLDMEARFGAEEQGGEA